jgi:hypothetical protein
MNGIRAMGTRQKPAPFLLLISFLVRLREGTGGMGRSALEKREVNAMGVRRDFLCINSSTETWALNCHLKIN